MQQAITFLSKKDEKLKHILEKFGNPIIQKRQQGFASMCHIILEQQVSIASALACYNKIESYFNEITPTIILNCKDEELKNCGVSRQKISYLKDLAAKVSSNQINFESFASKSEQQIKNELIQIIRSWKLEHWSISNVLPSIARYCSTWRYCHQKHIKRTLQLSKLRRNGANFQQLETISNLCIIHYLALLSCEKK